MKILIGLDGSSTSDAVIQEVVRRPWPAGSEFRAVTFVDPFFFTKTPQLMEEAKSSGLETLTEQTKRLEATSCPVQLDVLLDNPRHGLPRHASAWGAELVLLGSHGRSAVERLLVGSTARAVLRHAECSVEIVRARKSNEGLGGPGMVVMIPTDGSEYAEAAVRAVAERPWPAESVFQVVSCPEYPVLVGEYPYYPPQQLAELMHTSTEHAREGAHKGVEVLRAVGLQASCEVTEPNEAPTSAILGLADQCKADLIVMGSHGRRGFDRLILGSVSESVALHARCSVEVVRRSPASMHR